MNTRHDLFDEVSDQDMARAKDRVIRRGTQIRRRRFLMRTSLIAIAASSRPGRAFTSTKATTSRRRATISISPPATENRRARMR